MINVPGELLFAARGMLTTSQLFNIPRLRRIASSGTLTMSCSR
jgi:hypothetical protein